MRNTRAIAAQILSSVIRDQRSLTELFQQKLPDTLADRDRGLVKEYGYGVLRWYDRLRMIADRLIYKPLKSRDQDIAALLLIGLYQLIYLQTPPYAAVSETVAAASALKKSWAKGLVNQALQQFLRNRDVLLQQADMTMSGRWAHPAWLLSAIETAWPKHWQEILAANNEPPPLFLRVNIRQNSRDQYLQKLMEKGITAVPVTDLPQALYLPRPQAVENLPGFTAGACSVQDLASQYVVQFLDLQPGQRVLDACAAPGGKTGHILETEPALAELMVIDRDQQRLQRVQDNLQRLQLQTATPLSFLSTDAANPSAWWDGQPFDRILLDAPCSGTGVIRRHPDIKILRHPEDIVACARQQLALLSALWPLLKVGGSLLYTTCSIFPAENVDVISQFCQGHPDAQPASIMLPSAIPQAIGCQLLPTPQAHDGFYYALLQRN